MDTTKDLRILITERAVEDLEDIIIHKKLPYQYPRDKVLETIKEIKANIMSIKFSFMQAKDLINNPAFNTILANIGLIWSLVKPPERIITSSDTKMKLIISKLKYDIRIIYGLKNRIALGDDNRPEYAIDILGTKVLNVTKHHNADKLKITVVTDRRQSYVIVTNIQEIKKDWIIAVAFLPPVILYGVVSDGMFCSGNLQDDLLIGKRVPLDKLHLSEISSKILSILR